MCWLRPVLVIVEYLVPTRYCGVGYCRILGITITNTGLAEVTVHFLGIPYIKH